MNEMNILFSFKTGEQHANNNGYIVEIIGFESDYIITKNENGEFENFDSRYFIGNFYLVGWIE